jgi:hypothetical protein
MLVLPLVNDPPSPDQNTALYLGFDREGATFVADLGDIEQRNSEEGIADSPQSGLPRVILFFREGVVAWLAAHRIVWLY